MQSPCQFLAHRGVHDQSLAAKFGSQARRPQLPRGMRSDQKPNLRGCHYEVQRRTRNVPPNGGPVQAERASQGKILVNERGDAAAAIGTLDELPDLVEKISGGPAILIIGDVVAHAAPAHRQQFSQFASYFQVAAE